MRDADAVVFLFDQVSSGIHGTSIIERVCFTLRSSVQESTYSWLRKCGFDAWPLGKLLIIWFHGTLLFRMQFREYWLVLCSLMLYMLVYIGVIRHAVLYNQGILWTYGPDVDSFDDKYRLSGLMSFFVKPTIVFSVSNLKCVKHLSYYVWISMFSIYLKFNEN